MRILLFAINYHPEPTGSAPYMTRLARHLAATHCVTVVTGHPHYPSWRVRRAEPEPAANPRVMRYRHFVPRRPTAAGRALYEMSWLSSAGRSLLERTPYDVVLCCIPSLSAGLLAILAGRRHRVPIGLIFHDLIGAGASQSGVASARMGRSLAAAEASLARGASRVAVLCEDFIPYLQSRGVPPERLFRFHNWGRLGEANAGVEETRRRVGWAPSEFIALHAGNMGQKQALENAVDAAARLPTGVRVVLAGDGNDRPHLEARAQRAGIRNLAFLPVQAAGDYESMLAAADVLLVNQRPTVTEMSIPSKLTAYFRAGRPIVAAVDLESAAAREIGRAQAGRLVPAGDAATLADAILRLKASPEIRQKLGENGRRYAQDVLYASADLDDYDRFIAELAGEGLRSRAELLA